MRGVKEFATQAKYVYNFTRPIEQSVIKNMNGHSHWVIQLDTLSMGNNPYHVQILKNGHILLNLMTPVLNYSLMICCILKWCVKVQLIDPLYSSGMNNLKLTLKN